MRLTTKQNQHNTHKRSESGEGIFFLLGFCLRQTCHRRNHAAGKKKGISMNPLIQLRKAATVFLVALVWFGLLPKAQAVSPAPDGGYAGGNTAEGQAALLSLTAGGFNTAVGFLSLRSNTTGQFNTAIGAGTLLANTADQNTATGVLALLSNTTGLQNTANGVSALFSNTEGPDNTANGALALFSNTTGGPNTADGAQALQNNTTASFNTAIGDTALFNNTTGGGNTAVGSSAGFNQTTGGGNVYIGFGMNGVAGETNSCYIASIFGQTSTNGVPVFINSDNKLGTTTSSKRFKQDIKPMDKASEALLALRPVTFRYKKDIDPAGISQFGLVAEDVEKVNPDLVVRDKEGRPYSVRYDQVNAMLLNEFLKEHRKTEKLEATVVTQQKQIEALTAGLQKVSAQLTAASRSDGGLELSTPATQTVLNNQ
jgi:hypothetical protein